MTAVVGLLVALATWCVVNRGGRRAAAVARLATVRGDSTRATGHGGLTGPGPGPGSGTGSGSGTGPGTGPGTVGARGGRSASTTWWWRRAPATEADAVRLVVAQVGALVRAGQPPGAAWERAAGVGVDASGVPRVADLAPHVGGESTAVAVAAACRLAADVGAPLVTVLEEVSASIAADAEARAARDAALAGPRATARVLLWLPAVGVLLGYALGADPVGTALDGGIGTAGVLLGVVLLAAGRAWTARLVDRARSAGEEPA